MIHNAPGAPKEYRIRDLPSGEEEDGDLEFVSALISPSLVGPLKACADVTEPDLAWPLCACGMAGENHGSDYTGMFYERRVLCFKGEVPVQLHWWYEQRYEYVQGVTTDQTLAVRLLGYAEEPSALIVNNPYSGTNPVIGYLKAWLNHARYEPMDPTSNQETSQYFTITTYNSNTDARFCGPDRNYRWGPPMDCSPD